MQVLRAKDLVDLSEVGRGQNGPVFKTLHLPTGKLYARKEIKLRENTSKTIKSLSAELAATEKLAGADGSRVVHIQAVCCEDLQVSLLMGYCSMGNLDQLFKRRHPLPEPMVGHISVQVLLALKSLLAVGILHRDIKPGNILIDRCGNIKLCDFGESNAHYDQRGHRRLTSQVGTLAYMSPERILGEEYDERADVWSLGIMLLELASGQHPVCDMRSCSPQERDGLPTPPMSSVPDEAGVLKEAVPGCLEAAEGLATIELAQTIVGEDLFQPANAASVSRPLAHLICQCLQRDAAKRPTIADLLRHPFILRHAAVTTGEFLSWLVSSSAEQSLQR